MDYKFFFLLYLGYVGYSLSDSDKALVAGA